MVERMLVYVAPRSMGRAIKRFHKDLGCTQLTKRPSKGMKREPIEIELNELVRPIPCQTCYPDAPVLKSVHRYCPICDTYPGPRPCPHNGGVPITRERVHSRLGSVHQPGDTYPVTVYVWPEHVYLYVS
jgi:hypothetical protein